MKNNIYIFVALLATTFAGIIPAIAQKSGVVSDTVAIGADNEVYYSMYSHNKNTVNRKQWDIAFRASRMSASILTNDGVAVQLYTYPKSDTSGWLSVDTTGFSTWKLMVNSTTDWETGAFCQYQKGHPDYGWGKYNPVSHNVVGDSLFIIKLRDGSFRKLWIKEKFSADNKLDIRYANLNGTKDTTVTIDCSPFATKNFVGYSLSSNVVVDFEPVAATQWDLLFTKYTYTYPPSSPNAGTTYLVSGILSNYTTKVNVFKKVAPDYRLWNLATMDSTRSPIGIDWKVYTNTYVMVDSTIYFVMDQGKNIFRVVFTSYMGGSTGKTTFTSELISAYGINEIEKSELNAAVYPNPIKGVMNLIINPGKSEKVLIMLLDMSGRMILSNQYALQADELTSLQIPVSDITSGIYLLKIQAGNNTITKKIVVKN